MYKFDIALWAALFAVMIISYLIGSIPTGYLIVKAKTGKDIREIGSGSTGATNVKRVLGKKWFFIVMILDALKGALPVFAVKCYYLLTGGSDIFGMQAVVAAICVIIGHSKSVFLNGKGGKSVASGVGTIIALNWQTGLILACVWGIITYITRYVSVGSIIALILSPFLMYFFKTPSAYIIYCVIAAVYVTYLHRENIKRLIKGEENKVR